MQDIRRFQTQFVLVRVTPDGRTPSWGTAAAAFGRIGFARRRSKKSSENLAGEVFLGVLGARNVFPVLVSVEFVVR